VALRDDLELCSAQLYRFACALVCGHPGPCAQAADLVRGTLSSALKGSPTSRLTGHNLRIRLYTVLIKCHRDGRTVGSIGAKARVEIDNFHIKHSIGGNTSVIASSQDNFSAALLDLGLDEREAFVGQAARILKISRSVLVGRLARARAALSETVPVESSGRPVKARPTYLQLVK
jgi:DNA-directed RNA polymerase specialized sigma24 family protein